MPYIVERIAPYNRSAMKKAEELLRKEGIERDGNLEYTAAVYDGDKMAATGSFFGNTIRCVAVGSDYRGEGLLGTVLSHLLSELSQRGTGHVFVYTKWSTASQFESLGFYRIADVKDTVVFLENKRDGFESYLQSLENECGGRKGGAAVIMNANPFTKGHLYLAERAARENELLHVFIVSEDKSLVPYEVRKELIKSGLSHLENVVFHDTGSYMISSATFPSYFLKDSDKVSEGHAKLDIEVFSRIAKRLGITKRYVGSENKSRVTSIYNSVMAEVLPQRGIECVVVERARSGGRDISASDVRKALKDGDFEALKELLPPSSLEYFMSDRAKEVIDRIKDTENVIHH